MQTTIQRAPNSLHAITRQVRTGIPPYSNLNPTTITGEFVARFTRRPNRLRNASRGRQARRLSYAAELACLPDYTRSVPVRMTGCVMMAALFSIRLAVAENTDKSQYTLFNPTPRELMRELSTDRPDLTESPFTVDAGHFQFEMDAVSYSHDREGPVRTDTFSVAAINLKAGLCNQVDLQVILEPFNYVRIRDHGTGLEERHHGFGDITTRVKVNLWGNDGGSTALGVMPFVKFPSNQDDLGNDAVEGGLIIPFAAGLPAGWGMGAMTELDFMEDGDGSDHHAEFINTITFGHDIVGNLAGYVEFFSLVSTDDDAPWVGSFNFGLTYGLDENTQLDLGCNFGVTSDAPDFNPFVGLSRRF